MPGFSIPFERWEPFHLTLAVRPTISPIGFAAMPYAANFNGVGIWADEEEAVVAYTQPKFVSALHSFHVTHARLCKTEEH